MRTFLSYNTTDKILAGKIKQALEKFGFSVFLAHDDIKPTQIWINRILDELDKSGVFLPLLTKNFHKSKWTTQESGIAIGRKIFVISLKVNTDPQGFLARYQALRVRPTNLKRTALEIGRAIADNVDLRRQFLNDLIRLFESSSSFEEAGFRSSQLNLFKGYTPSQVNAVLHAANENDQIYKSWPARQELDEFIRINRAIANVYLIREYKFNRVGGNAG